MSWEIFKQNILRVANNPDGIPDTDTVANLYATEYDAAIKRGHDTINNVSLMHGNVDAMKQIFKAALDRGLTSKEPYDLVGQMGEGVKAYWAGATLNQYPIPKIPAVGSTQNVSVTSNIVTNMGQWQTSISKASAPEFEEDENGNKDDTPVVEGKEKEQYEKRNNVIIEPGESIESKEEEITLTREVIKSDTDLLAQKPPIEYVDDPGDFPPKIQRFKAKSLPFKFGADKNGTPPGAYPPGNLGPAPKVYGNVGSEAYPGADDFRKNYKNAYIPLEAMIGIETGAKARYKYKGQGGWMLLHPEAANQYFKLKAAAKAAGIQWTITSAYRDFAHQTELVGGKPRDTVASEGSSPHGWGGAIDIAELYAEVGGSGDAAINKAGRERSALYRWLSNNAPQFGWYNPARLADNYRTDEMWHWEYWGHWTANPPKPSTETNTGEYVTFNINKDLPTAIIWGGIDFATPSWMAQQIPQEIKNSKKIIIAPYTIPLETILIKFKGIRVSSVSGFSAGGNQCWPHAGKYAFTGLIDPSTSEKAVTSASAYASSWSGVIMYYNNGNWNDKYKAIGQRQVTAAGYLGSNAIKVSLNHSAIPAKFFQLYGHKL
jgi:hypothetical protein